VTLARELANNGGSREGAKDAKEQQKRL